MPQRVCYGILGTGNIARQFAAGVTTCRRGRIAAVGSRNIDSARAFAQKFAVPNVRGSYDELLADPAVEVAYISLPNTMHREWAIKALRAGKHVLCEKPMAVNAAEAQEMFDVAQREGRLLMEAFMYRCHPLTHAVVDVVRSGQIGQLRLVRSSFCFLVSNTDNIRFVPGMAGGVLMDVGCYCISYSRLMAGQEPVSVHAEAHMHSKGVDDIVAGTLRFPNGVLATFTVGFSLQADNTASVCGTNGWVETPVPWKPPATGATYTIGRSTPPRMEKPAGAQTPPREVRHVDAGVELFGVEADDFAASVQDGTALRISADDTLGNMKVLDELRRQIGVA